MGHRRAVLARHEASTSTNGKRRATLPQARISPRSIVAPHCSRGERRVDDFAKVTRIHRCLPLATREAGTAIDRRWYERPEPAEKRQEEAREVPQGKTRRKAAEEGRQGSLSNRR